MARRYKKLSYTDRLRIQEMCAEGVKPKDIAEKIGVHRATLYTELSRGGAAGGNIRAYRADVAQKAIFA